MLPFNTQSNLQSHFQSNPNLLSQFGTRHAQRCHYSLLFEFRLGTGVTLPFCSTNRANVGAVLDPWSANVTGCAGEWTKLRGAGAAEGQWPGGATEVS